MKFKVERTSQWNDESPCKEAFKEKYLRIDKRAVNDPVKIPFYKGDKEKANADWYGNGLNHRLNNGHIERDFEDSGWFVEFSTIEELLQFIKRYGQVVVSPETYGYDSFTLEIYDGYRE